METVTLNIRKMTGNDIAYVRKLPVQLTGNAAIELIPRKFRWLMHDRNYRLLVCERDQKVAAFAGLNFSPSADSGINFLVVNWFAADRFALSLGLAAELEKQATELALENNSVALLVSSDKLTEKAKQFYLDRGYVLNGNTLIKKLDRN